MEIEAKINAQTCDWSGEQREHVQLTITRHRSIPSHILLGFGDKYYAVPIEELKDALYYFHEEMHR